MSIKVSGFIKRIDYSDKFGNFTPTHSTFGKNTYTYNPDTSKYVDFEIVSLNRLTSDDAHTYEPINQSDMLMVSNVVNWLFNSANGVLTANIDETNARLKQKFGSAILTVIADEMVVDSDNNILPNRIQFDISVDGGVNSYTYWMNSLKFTNEYDGYDATIFIPTTTVDGMVTSKVNLEQIINSKDIDDYNNELNSTGKKSPYTAVRSLQTTWVNKDDSTETMIIRITFACYGPISDDLGILKQVLRKYIMANSKISEAIWERTLPEIFTATTFIVIPAWDYVSGGLSTAEIYNPILMPNDGIAFYKEHMTGFNDEHLNANLEILPIIWQSLGMYVCSNPNNPIGSHTLRSNITDYILAVVGSGDFIRLTTQTKDFILKVNSFMPIIEKYTAGDVPSKDLVVEVIDNLNFLVFTSFNVKCKVLCKKDYLAITGKVAKKEGK